MKDTILFNGVRYLASAQPGDDKVKPAFYLYAMADVLEPGDRVSTVGTGLNGTLVTIYGEGATRKAVISVNGKDRVVPFGSLVPREDAPAAPAEKPGTTK